jgi:hypothetical protein
MPITTEILQQTHIYSSVFIETGSHEGLTIDKALLAGYEQVKSIEISEHFYFKCREKYILNNNIKLYHGSSYEILPRIIDQVKDRITFWFDAHYTGNKFEYYGKICPVIEELRAISQHHRKDHIILIDDARLFKITGKLIHNFTGEFEISLNRVYDAIYAINPSYVIKRLPGLVPDDIIAAIPPDLNLKLFAYGPPQ